MNISLQGLVTKAGKLKEGYDLATQNPTITGTAKVEQLVSSQAASKMLGAVLLVLLAVVVIWFVALYLLIKNWNLIPAWAKVMGVLGLLPNVPMGPVITIIVVLAAKRM